MSDTEQKQVPAPVLQAPRLEHLIGLYFKYMLGDSRSSVTVTKQVVFLREKTAYQQVAIAGYDGSFVVPDNLTATYADLTYSTRSIP